MLLPESDIQERNSLSRGAMAMRSELIARSRKGFLGRLAGDARGNTLAIMAAALVPIAAMIGSGLDMGRAYLAKSKLQIACDAAALATRRHMGNSALSQASIDEGERFFAFNFPPGTMQSSEVDLDIQASAADASTVEVSASTEVPTTIMAMFGAEEIPITVACSADQDYVHNDIMLVLDVTGSMNCEAGTNCSIALTEQSNSRLSRLRGAASALYRALEDAGDVRTRYGFMPYSMSINVGGDLDQGWLREPSNYWRRECVSYRNNGSCRTMGWVSHSVSHDSSWFTDTWDGCIEERSTISENDQDEIQISDDVAKDDIDSVSTTEERLKWQPYDIDATVGESGLYDMLTRFCPAPASRLAEYDSEEGFQAQVDASLARVGGYTNHDLGMMWGMRYLSASGMFETDNPTEIDDMRVERHIVFLTDGEMTAAGGSTYSAFGVRDAEDRLVNSGSVSVEARHKARFLAACNRARMMGMTIWVIALDVGSSDDIRTCASGEDHFFESDGSNLDHVFDLIGKGIGRLRMTR